MGRLGGEGARKKGEKGMEELARSNLTITRITRPGSVALPNKGGMTDGERKLLEQIEKRGRPH